MGKEGVPLTKDRKEEVMIKYHGQGKTDLSNVRQGVMEADEQPRITRRPSIVMKYTPRAHEADGVTLMSREAKREVNF